jgi:N-methylhydantoinase B
MVTGVPIRAGDLFQIVAPNGGGFGDPCEREPGLVRDDVLDGFTTPEQARRAYGVVFDEETLDVDMAETVALRAQLAEERDRAPAAAPR